MFSKNGHIGCTRSHKQCALKHTVFIAIFFLLSFLLSGCIAKNEVEVTLKNPYKNSQATTLNATVSNVQIVNNQIIITGSNLNSVTDFKIKQGPTTTGLAIESKSSTTIIANIISNVSFATEKLFDFILSNASGAATYQVSFTMQNGTITAAHLSSMGATKGQVMKYNGTSWVPSSLTNAQTYLGTWNATSNSPDLTSPSSTPGDYYIVSTAGTLNSISYAVGDWIISDGYNWQKVANSSVVVSTFNGRRGIVTLQPSDYVTLKDSVTHKVTGSSLNDLADLDLTTTPPANGDFLKYNGTKWVSAAASITETDPTVSAFAKTSLPTCGAGQVLKSNGTTLSCVTSFSGAASRAVATDSSGALTTSTTTDTELGYLSGVTSSIQAQLNAKASSASVVDWSIAGVQTINPTRLNLPTCGAGQVLKSDGSSLSCVADNTGAGSFAGPINKVVLTDGTTGALATSAVSNTELGYLAGVTSAVQTQIDSKQASITSASTLTTGSLQTKLQGGLLVSPYGVAAGNTGEIRFNELAANGSNFVALKAADAIATDITLTLPTTAGTNGQVLTTSGATGLLTWSDVATTGTALTGDIGGTISANTIGSGKVTLTHLSATGTKNNTTYLRGDNTWSALQTDVQAVVLSAYTLGTNAVVAVTDTINSAIGKLQKQISDLAVSAVGGDLSGTLPNPVVSKIQGTAVSSSAPLSGQFFNFNGTNWAGKNIVTTDLKSSVAGNLFPGTGCAANQTLYYSVVGDAFSCANIDTLDAGKITTGTIAAARLPASATYWSSATGGINYAGGNVGIGTNSPSGILSAVATSAAQAHLSLTAYYSNPAKLDLFRTNGNGNIATASGDELATINLQGTSTGNQQLNVARISAYQDGAGAFAAVPGRLSFFTSDSSGNETERIRINSSGNVGIGTTGPSHKLDVANLTAVNDVSATQFSVMAGADATLGPLQYLVGLNPSATAGSRYGFIGIGDNSAMRPLILNSNGAGAFGNVGIGTTSPNGKLDVQGGRSYFAAASEQYGVGAKYVSTGGSVYFGATSGSATPDAAISNAGGSTLMTLQNGGNVGIGTTAPGASLDVTGATGIHDANGIFLNGTSSSTVGVGNYVRYGSNFTIQASSADSGLQWNAYNGSAWTTPLTLLQNGNVGIGTTVPTTKLQVTGASLAGTDQSGTFRITSGTGVLTDEALTFGVHDGDYSWMQAIKAGSSWRNLSLNPNGGSVGIGTTAPGAKLTVNGNNIVATNIANSSTVQETKLTLNPTSDFGTIGTYHTLGPSIAGFNELAGDASISSGLKMYTYTNGTQSARMTILGSSGNVGIGTTSPSANLHVYSTTAGVKVETSNGGPWALLLLNDTYSTNFANAAGFYQDNTGFLGIRTGGSGGVSLAAGATSWAAWSDRRLKTNIREYSVLDRLDGFRAVTFDWKKTGKREVGVIAQEVYKVFPDVVNKGSDENAPLTDERNRGAWSVTYDRLGALALEASKELYGKVKELFGEVEGVRRGLAGLKAENIALKAVVSQANAKTEQVERENRELKAYLCSKDFSAPFCAKVNRKQLTK